MALAILVLGMPRAGAVTCLSCNDGIPGCAGGAACPMYSVPFVNGEILRAANGQHEVLGDDEDAEAVVHTLLTCASVLPLAVARFLTRPVLDFFKTVARRSVGALPVTADSLSAV